MANKDKGGRSRTPPASTPKEKRAAHRDKKEARVRDERAMETITRRTRIAVGVVVALLVVLVAGSALYWVADGRPRSPAAFRELVAESGLVVDWSNNGPRAGDGVVVTDCGEVVVSVNELDGDLWVTWDAQRAPITPDVVDEIARCDAGTP